ncbi:phospholipid/glycerol acyltransferase [Hydrogenophaga taeniospiralis CCUG 15921]|uniref:Phospholipid/glycerol acyltransferase n=1 Tax=Hydrogenophaga taeniospiralis CCUG 15921 TaxID=1281780 RepID=A0A9X4NUQ0_9BURK|nr:lysophospholipid acyltransferase family protein [Hydrogenophaga taeniospiralis]MDG5978415.1 phospholipid/glycerol acyltransferase [Hydrogenophaga taeniospiralis CCUG 15921]
MEPEGSAPRRLLAALARLTIVTGAGLITGLRSLWIRTGPTANQTVYFANHTSHGDFVLLWAALPPDLRTLTRPVAGEDYWNTSALRRFIGRDVFNALMIRRDASAAGPSSGDPLAQMGAALTAGDSLIIFPEGTRNTGEAVLLPLKSGIYHLSRSFGHVRFVPVWIENLKRVLPKGALLPVPLACSVRFGEPLTLIPQEDKQRFLQRARQALLDLRPEYDREADPAPPAPPSEPSSRETQTPGSGA